MFRDLKDIDDVLLTNLYNIIIIDFMTTLYNIKSLHKLFKLIINPKLKFST